MPQLGLHTRCLDKNTSWCTKQTHLAMTSLFFFFFVVSTATGSSAKLDSPKKN